MKLLDWMTIAFVVLKLLGRIDWSWWAVLAPTWVPLAAAVFVLILAVAGKVLKR